MKEDLLSLVKYSNLRVNYRALNLILFLLFLIILCFLIKIYTFFTVIQ